MYQPCNEFVARVSAEFKGAYQVLIGESEHRATLAGRYLHRVMTRRDFPCVGDYVMGSIMGGTARIHGVLPRRSIIVRRCPGGDEQPIAANVDVLFIVSGLDGDFNVRRIERYISLAHASGVTPVIVLNKADACSDLESKTTQIEAVASGIALHVVSALLEDGIEKLSQCFASESTVAMVGSSGAGKSTLANALLGRQYQTTGVVRADDSRGRHTTTHRQLILLPNGASLIDTPGLRELQLLDASDAIENTFEDIELLAASCRFSDCAHNAEPGCAVRDAIGVTLDAQRFQNYLKLQREQAYYERRGDRAAEAAENQRWKAIHKEAQAHMRFRRKQR